MGRDSDLEHTNLQPYVFPKGYHLLPGMSQDLPSLRTGNLNTQCSVVDEAALEIFPENNIQQGMTAANGV